MYQFHQLALPQNVRHETTFGLEGLISEIYIFFIFQSQSEKPNI